jgi:hypothetical protein
MEAFLWMFLPVFVAGGSSLLSYYIMQARMEVALAKERESLAEARATISSQKITMEERIKATEEATKRLAMDEFMHDFRVDERSYARESKSLTASRKTMVMQERLFFRNIPLSNWIEREMVVEEGMDLDQLPKESAFATAAVEAPEPAAISTTATLPTPAPFPAATFPPASYPAPAFSTEVMAPQMPQKIAQTEDLMVLSNFLDESSHHDRHEAEAFVGMPVPAFGAQ